MTEKKKKGVATGVDPRAKRRANMARLREFIEQCRQGTACLPTRGLSVNYVELSRQLFGTSGSIKPENRAMREIVEAYIAENPVHYAGDNKHTRAKAAALGCLDTEAIKPIKQGRPKAEHEEILAKLTAYLDDCRQGQATLFRLNGRPAYKTISKHLFSDWSKEVRLHGSVYRELVDACFDDVYGLNAPLHETEMRVSVGCILANGQTPVNGSPTDFATSSWDHERFCAEMPGVEERLLSMYKVPDAYIRSFGGWREVTTEQEYINWACRMLGTTAFRQTSLAFLPALLMTELRHRRLLLMPLGLVAEVIKGPFSYRVLPRFVSGFTPFERRLASELSGSGDPLFDFLLCLGPISSAADFPVADFCTALASVMAGFPVVGPDQRRFLGRLRRLATALDSAALEEGRPFEPLARVQFEQATIDGGWRTRGRKDDPLQLAVHPTVMEWGKSFRQYVDTRRWKTPANRIQEFRAVLNFLETQNDPPALSSADLRDQMFGVQTRLWNWLSENCTEHGAACTMSTLFGFFTWYAEQHPGFIVPMTRAEVPSRTNIPKKTTKALIPRTILDEAKAICRDLMDAAFSGRSEAPESMLCRQQFDKLLCCRFPVPGVGFVQKLVPVLPALMYTLLTLPIRTIQARLLDSGEADEQYPFLQPGEGPVAQRIKWDRNPSPLALKKRREGWLRRIHDSSSCTDYLGFWININKTSAVGRGESKDFGYEIPWQHEELIRTLILLRDWQQTNNPISRLYSRADLSEKAIQPTEALAKQMPPYAFLFRLPKETDLTAWHEPVRYEAVAEFFLAVMDEIESRRRGTPNEVPIILSRGPTGRPASAVFSLHGLRVAGITAFAEAGVPAPVIAEFLAGHMTVLMTVYYQKFGPSTVTKMLNEAMTALDRARLADTLAGRSDIDQLRAMFVTEGADALMAAADVSPGLWALKLDGICPNGQTLCGEGGERDRSSMYGPVPGGARNCPLCRFWMTGPAFIAGQAIALNAQLYKLREKSEELIGLHARLRTLGAKDAKRDAIEHSIDAVEADIDLMIRTLQARYRLVMASLQLAEGDVDAEAENALSLVTTGKMEDVKAALSEVSDFRMLDFLSRSIEVFPELDCRSATFKRNVFLDQLLDREGFEAMLFRLPTEVANRAGNALGELIGELAGDDALDSIADGSRTLRSLGIDRVEEALQGGLGQPIRLIHRGSRMDTTSQPMALPAALADA